jgi:coproporphyrinogen III oxidase-like Fe-S oxidoreductase
LALAGQVDHRRQVQQQVARLHSRGQHLQRVDQSAQRGRVQWEPIKLDLITGVQSLHLQAKQAAREK